MSEKTFRPMLTYSDECHRSQFGDMHAAIVKHFKKEASGIKVGSMPDL